MLLSLLATFTLLAPAGPAARVERRPALPPLESASTNLCVGKPIRSNAPGSGQYAIERANDGDMTTSWWADKLLPVWAIVDLEGEYLLNKVNIVFYADGARYYRYTVELSRDGQTWWRVVDDARRTQPSPPDGDPRSFPPVLARYLRVNVLESHRAWGTAHAAEICAYEVAPEQVPLSLQDLFDQEVLLAPLEGEPLPDVVPHLPRTTDAAPVRFLVAPTGTRVRAWSGRGKLRIHDRVTALDILYALAAADALPLSLLSEGGEEAVILAGRPSGLKLGSGTAYHAHWENPRPERVLRELALNAGNARVLAVTVTLTPRSYGGAAGAYSRYVALYREGAGLRRRLAALAERANRYGREANECGAAWRALSAAWQPEYAAAAAAVEAALGTLRAEDADDPGLRRGRRALGAARRSVAALAWSLASAARRATTHLLAEARQPQADRRLAEAAARHEALASSRADRRALWFASLSDDYAAATRATLAHLDRSPWDLERALRYASYANGYMRRAASAAATPDTPAPRHPAPPPLTLPGARGSLCLNGTWERATEGTESAPAGEWHDVTVPHVPVLSTRFAWYRTTFTVPAEWAGSVLRLRFDGVAHYCEVFLNGYYCGSHRGSRPRFAIPVTDVARTGQTNELRVLVIDSTDSEIQVHRPPDRLPPGHFPEWDIYGRLAGIYQDVFLEAVPPVHAQAGLLTTSVRKRYLSVPITVTNSDRRARDVAVHPMVREGTATALDLGVRRVRLSPGESRSLRFARPWPDAKLWGVGGPWGRPHLYFLVTEVTEGERTLDRAPLRFGFRESWLQGHRFMLNGKPIRLQGYQTLYDPWHGPQMGNTEYMRRHMKLARRANFNTQRLFTSDCYTSLEVADELGFLSEACWYGGPWTMHLNGTVDYRDPVALATRSRFYREWVEAYGNYASVVLWSTENEQFAFVPGPTSPPEQRQGLQDQLAYWRDTDALVKATDPMRRPVHHHGCNGIIETPASRQLEVIGWHYPQEDAIPTWGRNPRRKPCIIGEWCPGGQGFNMEPDAARAQLEAVVKAVRDSERIWRRYEIAGDFPHYLAARATWCAHPRELRGPWPELEAGRSMPVAWPSLSGRGAKVPTVRVVPHYSYLINWFDPTRPEYTPNVLNDTFRECFDPMPPLPERIPPGLLITVTQAGRPVVGANLMVAPAGGQSAVPVGVTTDRAGTGWIWLQEAGPYVLRAMRPNGTTVEQRIEATTLPLEAPPGYDYLQRIELRIAPSARGGTQ